MSRSSQNPLTEISNDLTAEKYYDLLAAEPRRLALDVLAERTDPVDLEELAAEIAARTDGIEADNPVAVDRVATSLHHVHLPKLAALAAIEYDAETNVVERR